MTFLRRFSLAVALWNSCWWPSPAAAVEAPACVALDGTPLASSNRSGESERIERVEQPLLQLKRTTAAVPHGTVLVCPGGGYKRLAIDHEGLATAAFLNEQGYDAAILEYTIAAGPGTRDQALADGLAAWRLIRASAADLALHGGRFALLGYSAGGHLAARITASVDADEQPDVLALVYPAYLEEAAADGAGPAVQPPTTPTGRLFVLIAANDRSEWVVGCRDYCTAWRDRGGAAQLVVLADGGHGFGMRPDRLGEAAGWPALLQEFLAAPSAD